MRSGTLPLPLLLVLARCGSTSSTGPGPEPAPPTPHSPVEASLIAPEEEPPEDVDPIADAAATIKSEGVREDLAAIVGRRNARSSPDRLATVASTIERVLTDAGFPVSRQPVTHRGATADNLVGERPGSDPSRVVLVAAHYDAVSGSPGADDNASGVAALLAIARALARVPTRATVRMVSFAFEEEELAGSAHYVQSLDDAESQRIVLAIVLDMVGYRTRAPDSQRFPHGIEALAPGRAIPTVGDFIGVIGLSDTPGPVREKLRESRAYAGDLRLETLAVPPEAVFFAPDLLRGDHTSFWIANIPAIAVGDTGNFRNPHYHGSSDTLETLDLDFVRDVARWATAAAVLLAEPR